MFQHWSNDGSIHIFQIILANPSTFLLVQHIHALPGFPDDGVPAIVKFFVSRRPKLDNLQ